MRYVAEGLQDGKWSDLTTIPLEEEDLAISIARDYVLIRRELAKVRVRQYGASVVSWGPYSAKDVLDCFEDPRPIEDAARRQETIDALAQARRRTTGTWGPGDLDYDRICERQDEANREFEERCKRRP